MKNSYKLRVTSFYLLAFLLFSYSIGYGQISTNEEPISFRTEIPALRNNDNTHKVMPPFDTNLIEQADKESSSRGIAHFGFKNKVEFNLNNSGEWIELPNGDKLWRLSITCPNALSINLVYDKFWLPEGAKLFIYSNDKKHKIGAFTSFNNKGGREDIIGFATGILLGESITLEYYVPASVKESGIISIKYVVHGFRYMPPDESQPNNPADSCFKNVNCSPEGDNWQNEKNAIALILIDYNEQWYSLCTGFLVNTTANDARPLLMTANHCFCDEGYDSYNNSLLTSFMFMFNYDSPTCSPTTYPPNFESKTTSGAVMVANNADTDFALLRLLENPRCNPNITPYYLGWDNSEKLVTMGGVGIHHPLGCPKKISIFRYFTSYACMSFIDCTGFLSHDRFWQINWLEIENRPSKTHYGSSGSPLFTNSGKRVIGQLYGVGTCGFGPCNGGSQFDNYGKISHSWNGSQQSTMKRRLKEWLDPAKTNTAQQSGASESHNDNMVLSGEPTDEKYYYAMGSITSTQTIFPEVMIPGQPKPLYLNTIYIAGDEIVLLPGFSVGEMATFSATIQNCSGGKSISFTPKSSDDNNVFNIEKSKVNSSPILFQPQFTIVPNPNPGAFHLETNFPLSDIANLKITNQLGATVYETQNLTSNIIYLQNSANGLHFVIVMLKDGSVLSQKMVVNK